MKTRFRCPVCGAMPWISALTKTHELEFYVQELVIGYAKGWRFHVIEPSGDELESLRARLVGALMLVDQLIVPVESREIDIQPIVLDVLKQPSATVLRVAQGPTSMTVQGQHSRLVLVPVRKLVEVN